MNEIRDENGMHRVTKKCKERDPCMNEENQNPTRCHPSHGVSKCVYCCDTDKCNQQEILSADDSASTIISTSVALDFVTTVTSTVALSPVTDVTSTVNTQDSTSAVKSTATMDPVASKYFFS